MHKHADGQLLHYALVGHGKHIRVGTDAIGSSNGRKGSGTNKMRMKVPRCARMHDPN